tara:strand:+ start:105 stop:233 length:129 start_codon:yes stop_codon:yes gene_type:complete
MNIYELYTFYIENCIDEDKKEIPLGFDEWVENYGQQEIENTK